MRKIVVSIWWCSLFITSMASASRELIQESSTHLRVAPTLNPIVQEGLFDGKALLPAKTAWGFGLGVEVPILQWFNSGFFIQFNMGLPDFTPVSDISGIAKFQWPFAFGTGNFAPYVIFPAGISYTTVPVVDEIALRSANEDRKSATRSYDNGVGFNASVLAGLEFFPVRYIGAYAEAGYRATVIFHQIVKGPNAEQTWQYASYWIRGITISLGAKIAF